MSDGARIVLASGNAGKLREFGALLAPTALEVHPQSAFGVDSAEETGVTFIENALLKARHASRATGLPALADDSGLEVAALGGAPGVYSARYAGAEASDADNVDKLLAALADEPDRRAAFHCVIVALRHPDDPTPLVAEGRWTGRIAMAPSGSGGFGYDPVFLPDDATVSAAGLSPSEKQRLSHRGQAMLALGPRLSAWVQGAHD